ncbi:FAD-binding oxidoreductase [Nocardia sp. X0981]
MIIRCGNLRGGHSPDHRWWGESHTRTQSDTTLREAPIDEFTTDFGGRYHAGPALVHRMPEVFPSVLLGSGRGLTLRGAGHSCDGQTVTDGELLVTYAPVAAARQMRELGEDMVEVPAGANWQGVESYLNGRGRTLPVLTDHPAVSVGGTLSVGGIGIGSVRYGMQVDQVERIQLTDGTGTSRWCSRTDHPELFRFALGGLGALGLIERVVLRTLPYRPFAHLHRVRHHDLAGLVGYTERAARRDDIDSYCGSARRGVYSSTTGMPRFPSRCAGDGCLIVRRGQVVGDEHARPVAPAADHVRMWCDYLVPAGCLELLVEVVESSGSLERVPMMLYFLIVRRPPGATAFAFAPAGPAPVSIGLGVYATVRRTPDAVAATRRLFAALLKRSCELGGRPYLYGIHDFDEVPADRFYGSDPDRLAQLRSLYRLEHINAHLRLVRAAGTVAPHR